VKLAKRPDQSLELTASVAWSNGYRLFVNCSFCQRMKPYTIATLVVRGNALAMLIVAVKGLFDLAYVFWEPAFAQQKSIPGAMRYSVVVAGFELGISVLLFVFSRRIGRLFSRGLNESDQ
jgi:hypothetical protein